MTPDRMKLRYYPDPVLLQKGVEITRFDAALKANVDRMFEIMAEEGGVGLAAPQVGWSALLFIMGLPKPEEQQDESESDTENTDFYVIANPKFTYKSEDQEPFLEGCLSFPEIRAEIARPTEVEIEYQDITGAKRSLRLNGLGGRCIQHEYDHIHGLLFNRLWKGTVQLENQEALNALRLKYENRPDKVI